MRAIIVTAAYIGSIVAANWATSTIGLVAVGPLLVTAGTFAAGAALLLRDSIQQATGRRSVVLAAILAGTVVSYLIAPPILALASGLAFAVSELVDWGVFTPAKARMGLPGAVVLSSAVAAPVDTVLFLHLAGFGVTWEAVLGQFVVKTGLALLAAGLITAAALWATRRR